MPTTERASGSRLRARAEPRGGGPERAVAEEPAPPLGTIGLAAVLMAVPVAVLASTAGPYDDPKAWALPILVGLTGLGWLVFRRARATAEGDESRADRVLAWLAWGTLAWSIVATAASIAPGLSLAGSFGRGMGLFTIASGPVLFFLVRSECRRPESARVIADAALLGSGPVCLLALAQAIGWDPMPRAWDPAVASLRVRSTLGQHIFLGSYLVVLIPLAVARLMAAVRTPSTPSAGDSGRADPARSVAVGAVWTVGAVAIAALASRWPPLWWALAPWGVIGGAVWARRRLAEGASDRGRAVFRSLVLLAWAQVLVVILCAARGPLLGMLLGLATIAAAFLVRRRTWRPLAVGGVAVALVAVVIALVGVPGSPLARLAKVAVVARLAQLADASPGTPVRFRLDVWAGIAAGWWRQLRGDEIVAGTSPWVRSAIGFGPDTQLVALEFLTAPAVTGLEAQVAGWRAQYLVDRAHNAVFDQLVTEGLVGAVLWLGLAAGLIVSGVARLRAARSAEERALRMGCLGAVLAHLAESQVGIVTAAPLMLFWVVGGLLTAAPWPAADDPAPAPAPTVGRSLAGKAAVAVGVLAVLAVAAIETRWLLASIAYAEGARSHMAGHTAQAREDFHRSGGLMPWIPLTLEAQASTALRLAGIERDPTRRLELLRQGEAALAEERRIAPLGGSAWALSAQLAFARVGAGDRTGLQPSLDAFETAVRLRPRDAQLLAQWGLAWLEAKDPARARQAAERALRSAGGRGLWLSWAVLSAAERDLGNLPAAKAAAARGRRVAPPDARRFLDALP